MNMKISKLSKLSLLMSLLILNFSQSSFGAVITSGKFELINISHQDATIFLNSDGICLNKIDACKNENDANCLYITELIKEPRSRINYYLAIPIAKESVKDLTVLYKYDEGHTLPESIALCLSILKDGKYETYYSEATYNWFVSTELYLSDDEGCILIDGICKKNYNEGNFLGVNLERIAGI